MDGYAVLFDIGNTNIKVGLCRGESLAVSYVLPSDERQTGDSLGLTLLDIIRHHGLSPQAVEDCIGSSVAPPVCAQVRAACERYLGRPLLLTPEDMPIPLENRYPLKHEVGADRLVGAFAARRLFPEAASLISVDFGTATTFDCVQGNAYLGGLIGPGVLSSASALAARTAKLPRISLEVESSELKPACSTVTSLNHGFVFGFAAMAEGLTARLRRCLPEPVLVVGTGGLVRTLAKVTDCFDVVRPDLLLDGLLLLLAERKKAASPGTTNWRQTDLPQRSGL
ncbi:MAG: type III pantothenate kinase [Desulfovibrio sp.]|jgi:type III pantothenate kinase|nr:type III pantothenate kinase [Desulfovibrio sp.]